MKKCLINKNTLDPTGSIQEGKFDPKKLILVRGLHLKKMTRAQASVIENLVVFTPLDL